MLDGFALFSQDFFYIASTSLKRIELSNSAAFLEVLILIEIRRTFTVPRFTPFEEYLRIILKIREKLKESLKESYTLSNCLDLLLLKKINI